MDGPEDLPDEAFERVVTLPLRRGSFNEAMGLVKMEEPRETEGRPAPTKYGR